MDEMDFSGKPSAAARPTANKKPAADSSSLYDPKLALEFFRHGGTQEQFSAGTPIFAENEKTSGFFSKGARIYLLLDGDVTLTFKGKPLELVLPGEIFGEMAAIADLPRSATATARKNCRVLSLDEKQFVSSLQKIPEFALMLMSVMAQRLRRSVAKLAVASNVSISPLKNKSVMDKKMLADLRRELGDISPTFGPAGQNVVTAGAIGTCMFVVTEGQISISVDGLVIEYVGPGGVFGEMALVDQSGRSATAKAETNSAWMLIGRDDFLSLVRSMPIFGLALMRSMSARLQHVGSALRAGDT
ncbi:MAG: cyclic nucleotide-binding domain-containing protein [Sulfuritalea sp.]|nr:cyclic nucleotide-binding domain-containing protein [Sulfuritalea sp.]